jgi:putative polyketide hydroxylase
MSPAQVPVVVVGGGIVGLTAALALGRHGVPALLVEARPGLSEHPRARGLGGRAMEIFREFGLADDIRRAGAELARSNGIHRGRTVAEIVEPLPRRPGRSPSGPATPSPWSPVAGARGTLDLVEPLVAAAARAAGAELRFGTRCVGLRQDAQGVDVELGDGTSVRAAHVVLADGAGGDLRAQLGVTSTRGASHGHQLNVLFHADLADRVRDREFSICLIAQPGLSGMLTALDNRSRWAFHLHYDPARESPADFPPARCAELVRRALGYDVPDLDVRGVLPWEAAERMTDRLRAGRVFLAGDTAHQMPPAGGRGASTGVADVHNLAWKIAAVTRGEAGDDLLETYHAERHPAGARAVAVSGDAARAMARGALAPPTGTPADLLDMSGAADRYRSAAVLPAPGDPTATVAGELDGSPGTRVPYAWVDAGRTRSTVDLPAGGWVLLTGPDHPGTDAVASAPVEAVFAAQAGISPAGALLVRPDGHVAWRSSDGEGLQAALRALPCAVGSPVRA